ncbi:molybdopterin-guanine dinucleotide biosynthesis protein MobB [Campylobacter sp. CX2-8023-23]|uniref:molybdopterin-guanine dinucleotide biosynthesis protein B n=1 Tax=Campylobacter porcelli TaxID=1660073 RepID=UPI002E9E6638|nr:molybdopterin-guanine dinucleotide biosynthesis protein MobB [Campylobacter sp. CX2-8023-23]
MKRLAVAFSGASGSGKTTLISKVANELISRGFKVAITKHDPGDKAKFDYPGKDSYIYSSIGADVAVVSPNRTSIFLKSGLFGGSDRINSQLHKDKNEKFEPNLDNFDSELEILAAYFGEFDYLLIEGLKSLKLPRITIFRDEVIDDFIPFSDVFATNVDVSADGDKFGLDDIDDIIKWIDKNAKRV